MTNGECITLWQAFTGGRWSWLTCVYIPVSGPTGATAQGNKKQSAEEETEVEERWRLRSSLTWFTCCVPGRCSSSDGSYSSSRLTLTAYTASFKSFSTILCELAEQEVAKKVRKTCLCDKMWKALASCWGVALSLPPLHAWVSLLVRDGNQDMTNRCYEVCRCPESISCFWPKPCFVFMSSASQQVLRRASALGPFDSTGPDTWLSSRVTFVILLSPASKS